MNKLQTWVARLALRFLIPDKIKSMGRVRVVHEGAWGRYESPWQYNTVGNQALYAIAEYITLKSANMYGDPYTSTPTQMQLGTNATPTTRNDTGVTVPCYYTDTPTTPTLSATGSGGSLTAGVYKARVTYNGYTGETTGSLESSGATVAGANHLVITLVGGLPAGILSWNAYLTHAGGGANTEVLVASNQTGSTVTINTNPVSTTTPPLTSTAVLDGTVQPISSRSVYNGNVAQWACAFNTIPPDTTIREAAMLDNVPRNWAHVLLAPRTIVAGDTYTIIWQFLLTTGV